MNVYDLEPEIIYNKAEEMYKSEYNIPDGVEYTKDQRMKIFGLGLLIFDRLKENTKERIS
jgi:hypothetical protein